MRKLIIILTLLLSVNCAFASQYSTTLNKIENSLFGFQYSNESESARLNRIEENVYGTVTANKSTAQRIAKLKTDLSADLFGQEITPTEDTFADNGDDFIEKEPVASSNVDYPVVNELEEMVFNKEFKNQDIKSRLANLENKTFGKSFNDDLSTRVDRLREKIQPPSMLDNTIAQNSDDVFSESNGQHISSYESPNKFDYDAYNASHQHTYNDNPPRVNLSSIEKKVFHSTYPNESMDNRLARLETSMFGTTFDSDTSAARVDRINSAYNAQKSASRYDSNKFATNITTAVQIGTLILMVLACIL